MRETAHRLHANGLTHFVRDTGDENAPAALLLHGFPDSSAVWKGVTPFLVDAGYRVIAPDLRGFGETDIAPGHQEYDIHQHVIPDILEILRTLNIARAHVAGHDFGAPVAWGLAANHPSLFISLAALSVGHPRAFVKAGGEQYAMSWYILIHQMKGVCEALYRFNDWALFRAHWSAHGDAEAAIAALARPGRLTAGLDWYRVNASLARMLRPPPAGAFGEEIVRIPTLGLWSDGEKYLSETQMKRSEAFVEAPWRYCRIDGASHWIPYDQPRALAAELIAHWRNSGA
ncbi:MAG: alpha/beta fold hydrolase [Hyphococcus sp.]